MHQTGDSNFEFVLTPLSCIYGHVYWDNCTSQLVHTGTPQLALPDMSTNKVNDAAPSVSYFDFRFLPTFNTQLTFIVPISLKKICSLLEAAHSSGRPLSFLTQQNGRVLSTLSEQRRSFMYI